MLDLKTTDLSLAQGKADIVALSHLFYDKNWSLATSSNYSMVLSKEPLRVLITASGKDKQHLTENDFVIVDKDGELVDSHGDQKQSAETLLHTVIAQKPGVGAVLHTHSVASTHLSIKHCDKNSGKLKIQGFEMIKAISLDGVKVTHETCIKLPIFANTQDMVALSKLVDKNYDSLPKGFLIAGHGLYTWGKDLAEAKRHVEGYEFLFEVLLKMGY